MGVWKCTRWSFHEIRPLLQGVHPICKLRLHEQFLKEEMKTPVLVTQGLWLSEEVFSGHSQAPRLCCRQTHQKMRDFSLLTLTCLQGKTQPPPSPPLWRSSAKAAVARRVFLPLPMVIHSSELPASARVVRALGGWLSACFLIWLLSKASLLPGWS